MARDTGAAHASDADEEGEDEDDDADDDAEADAVLVAASDPGAADARRFLFDASLDKLSDGDVSAPPPIAERACCLRM